MNVILEQVRSIFEIKMEMAESVKENYRIEVGKLERFPHIFEIPDWNRNQRENRIYELNNIIKNDGKVMIAKDENKVIGIASLKNKMYSKNRLQLYTLHIDRKFRRMGIGRKLLLSISDLARDRGADGLYISAAPKVNTIDFYLHCGAIITDMIEDELFDAEPDDIHLELMWKT